MFFWLLSLIIVFWCFKHLPKNNYYFERIWSFLGCLVTGLVREFLEYFDLDFTIAVFDPESNFVSQTTFLHIHLIHCFQLSNTHWTWLYFAILLPRTSEYIYICEARYFHFSESFSIEVNCSGYNRNCVVYTYNWICLAQKKQSFWQLTKVMYSWMVLLV